MVSTRRQLAPQDGHAAGSLLCAIGREVLKGPQPPQA